MATSTSSGEVTLLAMYCGKRLSLTVPTTAKVGDVVQKAAETLNLKKEDLPLSLLYQGNPIDDMAPLEDALAKIKGVTAIHLVKRTKSGKTTTARRTNSTIEGSPWAYCGTCEGLSRIRPIFTCSSCKKEGGFERRSQDAVDHFDGQYPEVNIIGTCNHCNKTDVLPRVTFQCHSCEEGNQAILRQIRDNVYDIPCMKCSLRQEIVIQMRCSSRHCVCLSCFKNMCRVKLDNDSFRNFEGIGYSVSCPGPGEDCRDVPIIDPHHFKIVDEEPSREGSFYKRFKDKSFDNYTPSGDDIFCVCKKEIAMSSAQPVAPDPENEEESQSNAAGQKWYTSWMSIFKKKQDPTTPPAATKKSKSRRKASCAECRREYCMECKSIWHVGDCPVVSDKELKEQEFPIQADLARSAQWPK